ncbi:hypothetical protein [Nocardia alni]|uniref:hypothetical protein n=1 Tax=Nocardia alni TaxID=2815723 RepID=UPI001C23E9A8|nr:hypothetical protein [Nocardia alni]
MDPIVTGPLLVGALHKVLDSAAGEAGKRAWDALTGLITRYRSRSQEKEGLGETVPETDAEIEALVRRILDIVATNPQLAAELRSWQAEVDTALPSTVSNTVSGNVQGNVVQARDISGPITFG